MSSRLGAGPLRGIVHLQLLAPRRRCRALRAPPPLRSAPRSARLRRGTLAWHRLALPLRAVAAARLLAVDDAGRVERAADDLVPDPREVSHPAAAHEHDR